jgi:methylated-DNA-[protein]-cysteine S-methyltransferase
MQQLQRRINSKIGVLYLVASEQGLQGVFWNPQAIPHEEHSTHWVLDQASLQLDEYFNGSREYFDIPLDLQGTPFQKQVWNQVASIPYGETRTYKDMAHALNHDKASRAVGTANRHNHLCIIIPCHRVIASDGSLGGYSGGLALKKQLLELEQRVVSLHSASL